MFTPHSPKLQFPDLHQNVSHGQRVYTVPGHGTYESMTTFLARMTPPSPGLEEWKARVGEKEATARMKRGAARGTVVHLLLEEYLQGTSGRSAGVMPIHMDLFTQIKKEVAKCLSTIYVLEGAMYSHKYRLAGRADLIGIWNGQLSVIDFKTATSHQYPDALHKHYLQAAGYARLFESMTAWPYAHPAVTQLVILSASEANPHCEIFAVPSSPPLAAFEAMWAKDQLQQKA